MTCFKSNTPTLSVIFWLAFSIPFNLTFGQVDFAEQRSASQILESYPTFEDAVLNMTREEWTVVRKWEDFDELRYLTFLHEYKDSFAEERARRKELRIQQVMEDDECGCWVEPDDTYTRMVPPPGIGGLGPNEMAWVFQAEGGGGWDVDCSSDALQISMQTNQWEFELYGSTYSTFFVNSKGQISFGNPVLDWEPVEFPAAQYNQIAGYWQDIDITSIGEIKWKRTENAVYVNYIDVGYWSGNSNLTNSFQIIITYPESGILPEGSNAQVCYLDMNWAHGDFGGGGDGCCGATPGVTGADGESTNPNPLLSPHVQFGRFNLLDDSYNGPYGDAESEWDGINWLDFKYFNINTAELNNNLNPVPTANLGCDTVKICLGQEYNLNVEFLGPEPGQFVTLDVANDIGATNTIENFSQSDGATATVTGTFVGNEPGVNTVTMVATDDGPGAASTTVNIVIEVLDVVPPSIEVATEDGSGEFGICAGQELSVVASSVGGQEDVQDWSWNLNPSFWNGPTADIPFGGTFVVTGTTPTGCVVKENFEVIQTPFYLPAVSGTNVTVCAGESTIVVVVDVYAQYDWVADWNGGGGEILTGQGAPVATLVPGTYQLTVTDEGGCQGNRTFVIGTTSVSIPDLTVEPICDGSLEAGFDSVAFAGGYASPEDGFFTVQMLSGSNWNGAYLQVVVTHPDSTQEISLLESFGPLSIYPPIGGESYYPELELAYGDSITVTFVGSGNAAFDATLQVDIYNCESNCTGDNADNCFSATDMVDGQVIYEGAALCFVEEAEGAWTVNGPSTYSFSNPNQFNTIFYPEDFGLYEVCFTDDECEIPHCFDVEVNLPPTIQLSEDSPVYVCDGNDLGIQAFVDDEAGVATIDWPYPGTDDEVYNEYSWSQYTETTLTVVAENGCGQADAQLDVIAQFAPELPDELFLCDASSSIELDPIAGDQNFDIVYDWFLNGNPIDVNDNELDATTSGLYCVGVVNECYPNQGQAFACSEVVFVQDLSVSPFNSAGSITDCDGGGVEPGQFATLGVTDEFLQAVENVEFEDQTYTITWPDGTVTYPADGFVWTIPEETEYNNTEITIVINDPYGCEPQTATGTIFIGDAPFIDNPLPDGTTILCPEQPKLFVLNTQLNGPESAALFTWQVECADTLVVLVDSVGAYFDALEISADDLPPSCWNYDLSMVANVSNPCLSEGVEHEFTVFAEDCDVELINVFTPRDGNSENNGFQILGLEPWEDYPEGVKVRIFDRWGNLVFSSDRFSNDNPWYADGYAEGVYFSTVVLPNGNELSGTVHLYRSR